MKFFPKSRANSVAIAVIFLLTAFHFAVNAQAAIPQAVADAVSGSVFEVVVEKGKEDTMRYDAELPEDAIPFSVRNEAYESIGTAFSIGGGRFLTAAHVMALGEASLRGRIGIRTADKKFHPIANVNRLSSRRDFAEFSVDAFSPPGIALSFAASLNTMVYAAGNALGQGVIVRDGTLTSRTVEDRKGEWSWLRFSAAASPGNSGGPLLDGTGKAIGLVTMKSEGENLNYALPSAEFLKVAEGSLEYEQRYTNKLPQLAKTSLEEYCLSLKGPMKVETLRGAVVESYLESYAGSVEKLYRSRRADLFPQSWPAIAESPVTLTTPYFAYEKNEGDWIFISPDKYSAMDSKYGGTVKSGNLFNYMIFEANVGEKGNPSELFEAPGVLLDRLLEAVNVSKKVGDLTQRIVSMGKPASFEWKSDAWGRRWIQAVWSNPALDYAEVLTASPTPEGAVGFFQGYRYARMQEAKADMESLRDFCCFTYGGTLSQWKSFLAADDRVPPFLLETRASAGAEALSLSNGEFSALFPSEAMRFTASSRMMATPWWYRGSEGIRMAAYRLYLQTEEKAGSSILIQRCPKAGDKSSNSYAEMWKSVLNGTSPYNRNPNVDSSGTYMSDSFSPGKDADPQFVYALSAYFYGERNSKNARDKFFRMVEGMEVRSAGIDSTKSREIKINGLDIFQAMMDGDDAVCGEFFASRISLEARNPSGDTPLLFALKIGREDLALRLIAAGANPSVSDAANKAALIVAAKNGFVEAARALLKAGADVNATDSAGRSVLMHSLSSPVVEMAMVSLDAIPNKTDPANAQAVLEAVSFKRPDIAQRLADSGFPLDARSKNGWSALMFAMNGGDREMAEFLFKKGAPLDVRNSSGWNTLHFALYYEYHDIAMACIEKGYGLEDVTDGGWKSVCWTAFKGWDAELMTLMDKGADPNAKEPNGNYALHHAAAKCSQSTVRKMLDKGADPAVKNAKGETPLDWARKENRPEAAALLESVM